MNEGKQISASVFATPDLARKMVRQDWDHWDLDFVFPMVYYQFYDEPIDFMKRATEEGLEALNGKIPLYTAFYLADKTPKQLQEARRLVAQTQAAGMAYYDYELLSEDMREILLD